MEDYIAKMPPLTEDEAKLFELLLKTDRETIENSRALTPPKFLDPSRANPNIYTSLGDKIVASEMEEKEKKELLIRLTMLNLCHFKWRFEEMHKKTVERLGRTIEEIHKTDEDLKHPQTPFDVMRRKAIEEILGEIEKRK